jgi:hypothetical protein
MGNIGELQLRVKQEAVMVQRSRFHEKNTIGLDSNQRL